MKSPEQFNTYSKEEAQEEASKMQEKIEKGEARNYSEAERVVEQSENKKEEMEKLIREAQDGTMVDKIRGLDLSKEEDRDELRHLVEPWDYMRRGVRREQDIYNKDGKKLFLSYNFDYFRNGILDLGGMLKKMPENFDSRSLDIIGHGIAKVDKNLEACFVKKEKRLFSDTPEEGDIDPFIQKLSHIVKFASQSFNMTYTGNAANFMCKYDKKNNCEHPQYSRLNELFKECCSLLKVADETVFRYLSNRMQDSNYLFSGEYQELSDQEMERFKEDLGDGGGGLDYEFEQTLDEIIKEGELPDYLSSDEKIYKVSQDGKYSYFFKNLLFRANMGLGLIDKKLEEKIAEYIEKVKNYKEMLKSVNSQIPYTKLEASRKNEEGLK